MPRYNLTPVYKTILVRETSIKTRPTLLGTERAGLVCVELLKNSPCEQLIGVALDTKHKVIAAYVITQGTLDCSLVHPREAFRVAILLNASALILAHNHPSGDISPSREDWAVYKRLKECGVLLGIQVMDSIIVNDETHQSMELLPNH